MNRGWLIELLKQEAQSCADDDDESGGVLGGYAEKFRQAAAMLQRDGEAITRLRDLLQRAYGYTTASSGLLPEEILAALKENNDASTRYFSPPET